MAETTPYHVAFEDPHSGESLGLLLAENGGDVRYIARLANPYAAKVGGGDQTLKDLTDLSTYGQSDWSGGRGQDVWEDEERYLDAEGIETRIKGQITLGPLNVATGVGDIPEHVPTSMTAYPIGQLSSLIVERSMSFVCPAGGISCTHIVLPLAAVGTPGGNVATVAIYGDDGGVPDDEAVEFAHRNLWAADLPTTMSDHQIVWSDAVTLVAATTYHIAISWASRFTNDGYIVWGGDAAAGYATGAPSASPGPWTVGGSAIGGTDEIDSFAWAAEAGYDLGFRVNDGPVLAGPIIVNPVRYADNWYCAAYDVVYKWTAGAWVSSDVQTDEVVTSMAVWGDYLWVARGANPVRQWNDVGWADHATPIQADLLLQYNGYLYYISAASPDELYYSSDGTTFSGPIYIGPGDWDVQGMAGFRTEVALSNDVGLWFIAGELGYQVLDWSSLERDTNGQKVITWSSRNELFIPVGHGIYRFSGASVVPCGPDQGTGLPVNRTGVVSALCGTVNWLFAAIDAGTTGYSSVMAYDGSGWHELARANIAGERIRAIGYETTSTPPRLWYGQGDKMYYLEMPDFTDNPYAYTGVDVEATGHVDLSSWGQELMPVVKEWIKVVLEVENCSSTQTVDVYYEVDRSGIWALAGTVNTANTVQEIALPGTSFVTKSVGAGSTTVTIEIGAGSTEGIVAGAWVRINDQIRQVESLTDIDTFVLALPLDAAPALGDYVFASAPAGASLRLRLGLATSDSTTSPKVLAVAAYCQANTIDRWQFDLTVRVEDGMLTLNGAGYPYDAKSLVTELDTWIKRQTSFTMYDLHGIAHSVKISNAVMGTFARSADPPWRYAGTIHLGLIETEAA